MRLSNSYHGVYMGIYEEEIVNLGSNVAWGIRKYAERGIVNGGFCYGYYNDKNRKWSINEDEANVVRQIYHASLEGKYYGVIAEELTSDNITSPGGKDYWHPGTIKKILTNVTYNGDYLFQKTFIKDTLEGTVVQNTGELPMYYIENHHEVIIYKDMWNEVQTILRKRSKQYSQRFTKNKLKKNSKNRAFEKKFYCGECGNLIGHYRYVSNNKESNNWKCNHARRYYLKDKCTAPGFQ